MKANPIRVFSVLLLAFVVLHGRASSAEPTRADTIDWLNRQFMDYSITYTVTDPRGSAAPKDVKSFVSCSFHGERVTLKDDTTLSWGGKVPDINTIHTFTVLLHDLAPKCRVKEARDNRQAYEPQLYDLVLSSSRPDTIVHEGRSGDELDEPLKGTVSEIRLPFTDKELAERVKNAFERLIKLSGGKEEPY